MRRLICAVLLFAVVVTLCGDITVQNGVEGDGSSLASVVSSKGAKAQVKTKAKAKSKARAPSGKPPDPPGPPKPIGDKEGFAVALSGTSVFALIYAVDCALRKRFVVFVAAVFAVASISAEVVGRHPTVLVAVGLSELAVGLKVAASHWRQWALLRLPVVFALLHEVTNRHGVLDRREWPAQTAQILVAACIAAVLWITSTPVSPLVAGKPAALTARLIAVSQYQSQMWLSFAIGATAMLVAALALSNAPDEQQSRAEPQKELNPQVKLKSSSEPKPAAVAVQEPACPTNDQKNDVIAGAAATPAVADAPVIEHTKATESDSLQSGPTRAASTSVDEKSAPAVQASSGAT